jgi:hypothetical protein
MTKLIEAVREIEETIPGIPLDIEFALNDDEYNSLKEEYKRHRNLIKVRKYLKTHIKGQDGKTKQGAVVWQSIGLCS